MTVSININKLTLCHKGSNGVSRATLRDVCKTPAPGGPVPIAYPNIAFSSDLAKGTTTVNADGGSMCANHGSEFSRSTGDEPGTVGGVKSGTFAGEATWITFSFDVKLEGKGACRLTDKMFHNRGNTVNMGGELQNDLSVSNADFCQLCKDCQVAADRSISSARFMQNEYRKAGRDPANKTSFDIESAVKKSIAAQGVKTKVAGSTDTSGDIKIAPTDDATNDPCSKVQKAATMAHEKVHKATQQALEKAYGSRTPAFNDAWNEGHGWAEDEVNAYEAAQKYLKKFKRECKASCP